MAMYFLMGSQLFAPAKLDLVLMLSAKLQVQESVQKAALSKSLSIPL